MAEDRLTPEMLAELFRARGDDLLAWFAPRTWDREAAVDMAAETFAQAVASRERFRGGSRPEAEAWLFGIAGNVLRLYLRKGRVDRRTLPAHRSTHPRQRRSRRRRLRVPAATA